MEHYLSSFAKRSRLSTAAKKSLLDTELIKYSIVSSHELDQSFRLYQQKQLEIGFGDGQHLVNRASLQPDTLFIGCEVYLNGIAQLLSAIKQHNINNILIYNGDARDLCKLLPEHSLSDVYVLFPDPWPKKRHNKRRIINLPFIQMLQQKITPNGRIVLATDHLDYAEWISTILNNDIKYSSQQPSDWITTKYEQKSLSQGLRTNYFVLDTLSIPDFSSKNTSGPRIKTL